MSATDTSTAQGPIRRVRAAVNGRHHKAAIALFTLVVVAHWTEHVVQAIQVWGLGMPRPKARGVLGQFYPWLVSSEWLHYGYAVVMLAFLWALRPGFVGRARRFWDLAFYVQVWHHFEHLLLLLQASTGVHLGGGTGPSSVLQQLFPRIELHLFYNTVVTIPMVIAVVLHLRPSRSELEHMHCSCGDRARARMSREETAVPA